MIRTGLALLLLGIAASGSAQAAESCLTFRSSCIDVCTPERVARYYAGSERRCTASCEPRFQHCIRTGAWADLEYLYSGGLEQGSVF